MGDVPFSIYFDFETTCSKKFCNFDEDATLYPVSYEFVAAFNLSLNLDRIFVVRSFNDTFDQLNNVGYLLDEMLSSHDPITVRQFRDCAKIFHEKKENFSLSEMFSCELKFVIDLLKTWLAEKYFRRYKELNFFSKQKFKTQNPIDWNKTECVTCNFCLPAAASNVPSEKNYHIFRLCHCHGASLYQKHFRCEQAKYHEALQRML